MKVEIELRTTMSRPELFRAQQVTIEATGRLAHRMSETELNKVSQTAMTLNAIAETERRRRGRHAAAGVEIIPPNFSSTRLQTETRQ